MERKLPKYEIGYQPDRENFCFLEMIRYFQPQIDTVYFPWVNMPSGREALGNHRGTIEWNAQYQLEDTLRQIKAEGIKLNLLMNANCYGEYAVSQYLQNYLYSIVNHLQEIEAGVDVVTTCSPAIAEMIKKRFPDIKVRASVNMRIGTVEGMEYLADYFDEYMMQREYNRDFKRIRELTTWAKENKKGIFLLANSGCLNDCSAQSYHDNLVAHEKEICEIKEAGVQRISNCHRLLQRKENWRYILQGSWIRPEDLHHYTEYFPVVKLATRMHQNPWGILRAYTSGSYKGALTGLMEPGFTMDIWPYIIPNHALPEEWFEKTSSCDKHCHECGYCESVLQSVVQRYQDNGLRGN